MRRVIGRMFASLAIVLLCSEFVDAQLINVCSTKVDADCLLDYNEQFCRSCDVQINPGIACEGSFETEGFDLPYEILIPVPPKGKGFSTIESSTTVRCIKKRNCSWCYPDIAFPVAGVCRAREQDAWMSLMTRGTYTLVDACTGKSPILP